MKFISWNVNGLRNCTHNGEFLKFFNKEKPDFFCIQEIKSSQNQIAFRSKDYKQYWNYSSKKGYSGTAVFTKIEPLSVEFGLKNEYGEKFDNENRIITLEYNEFFLINCYTPNSQFNRKRLNFRQKWDEVFKNYIYELNNIKDIILCGDFNVAHKDIDICNQYKNSKKDDFINEERVAFSELLNVGLIDTFRYFHPQKKEFTWNFNGENNEKIGWRLDYFLVSDYLKKQIRKANIYQKIDGSDHCPILLELEI